MNKAVIVALLVLASTACVSRCVGAEERRVNFDGAATTAVQLRVGISLGLEAPSADPYAFVQTHAYEGLCIWRDAFNNMSEEARTTRDGRVISFELVVFENYGRFSYTDPSHEVFMMEQILNMSRDTSLDFMLPPVGSPWGTVLRNASLLTGNVPFTIGIADSREYWYRLAGSYGAPTSTLYVMSSTLPYLRLNGAKTAYVIRMQETFQAELCQGFIDQSVYHDVHVSHVETVPFNYTTFGAPKTEQDHAMWRAIVDSVIERNDDVLVICDYGEASEYVISLLREKQHTPKAIVLSYKYAEFKDPSLAEFLLVLRSYHPDTNYPAQLNFVDSSGYNDLVMSRYQHTADHNNAQATLAGFLLSNAILLADNSSDKTDVELALRSSQLPSFMGRSRFDTQRRQLMENVIVQTQGGYDAVVGPAVASRAGMIYPVPSWEERAFKRRWGHATEIAGLVLMLVGCAISWAWFIFLIFHWRHPVVVMASPLFCALIIAGSIIIFASNVVWMPNLASNVTCALRAWLLPFGFTLLFGALIAKTHRIYKIFQIKSLETKAISDLQVMYIVLVLLAVQIGFSALMHFAGGIKSAVHVVDVWRPSHNVYQCTSNGALKYLYGIDIGCAVVLLGYGSFLAVRVRKIPMPMYDESTIIHFATYNAVIFSLIACIACLVQTTAGPSQRFVTYIILSVCMFVGPCVTVGLLFYSKLRAIYFPSSSRSNSLASLGTRTGAGNSGPGRSAHRNTSVPTAPANSSAGRSTSSHDSARASPPYSPSHKHTASVSSLKNASPIVEIPCAPEDHAQQIVALQRRVDKLRTKNARLKERLRNAS